MLLSNSAHWKIFKLIRNSLFFIRDYNLYSLYRDFSYYPIIRLYQHSEGTSHNDAKRWFIDIIVFVAFVVVAIVVEVIVVIVAVVFFSSKIWINWKSWRQKMNLLLCLIKLLKAGYTQRSASNSSKPIFEFKQSNEFAWLRHETINKPNANYVNG